MCSTPVLHPLPGWVIASEQDFRWVHREWVGQRQGLWHLLHHLRATVVITAATTAKGSLPAGLMHSVCRHPALRSPPSFQHCTLLPPRGRNEGPRHTGCAAALLLPLTAPPPHPAPRTAGTPEHISLLSLPSTPGFPSPPCKAENQALRCPDPPRIPWMVRARCRNLSQWPEQLVFLFFFNFLKISIFSVCARS